MRIIGGEFRSRQLVSPDNDITRPTTDRSRESLFNVLHHMRDLEGITVLDLFAGSGAVAIEAISRGARSATLVERDRKALAAIRANVASFELSDRIRVLPVDVFNFVKQKAQVPFDLIFADAPYAEERTLNVLPEQLFQNDWLASSGLCVIEHSAWKKLTPPLGAAVLRELKVGEAGFTFLTHPLPDQLDNNEDVPQ